MKKVLVAGAALMLVSGYASTVLAADYQDADLFAVHYPDTEKAAAVAPAPPAVKPGVVITGDARARFSYADDEHFRNGFFGNRIGGNDQDADFNGDSRVRINFTGTAAGGSYVKARLRIQENFLSDIDVDPNPNSTANPGLNGQNNLWADLAYFGIPFNDTFTMEIGKYRSTYGPLAATYNFFYDDVSLAGARGIIKMGDIEINPFIEWMEEAQQDSAAVAGVVDDNDEDNDEIRFGAHAKAKINKDWTVGGMLGYQMDDRNKVVGTPITSFEPNEGFFASIYTKGKSGPFGLAAELAVTDGDLNGFNSWEDDAAVNAAATNTARTDRIGSDDTGFGAFAFPNYQIDKLNIGLNLGFTANGFQPDRAFGFVMIGSADNSQISAVRLGDTGDWMWAGLVAEYSISEALKLTGNLVYADIDAWKNVGDGPNSNSGSIEGFNPDLGLENAWEISAVLQYTISKGADVYFSAGYLQPELENTVAGGLAPEDDGTFAAMTRFELKF